MYFHVLQLYIKGLALDSIFLKMLSSLQRPSRTADLRSVFRSFLPPKPLISWWIPVVHCLMQNEEFSVEPQSRVCQKNMGQMQVYLSLKRKKEKAYFPSPPLVKLLCCPGGLRIRQKNLCNAARDLSTLVHFNNLVTKWLMTCLEEHVSLIQHQSPIHYQNKEGDSCVCQ